VVSKKVKALYDLKQAQRANDDLLTICKDLVRATWVKDRRKEAFAVHDQGKSRIPWVVRLQEIKGRVKYLT
jgi:hypothetical protein